MWWNGIHSGLKIRRGNLGGSNPPIRTIASIDNGFGIDARFCFAHLQYEYCVNSLLFSFARRLRHILHSNALAGVLFDVLLEVILLHLQIAHKAVMDDYALDTVLALALNF